VHRCSTFPTAVPHRLKELAQVSAAERFVYIDRIVVEEIAWNGIRHAEAEPGENQEPRKRG
jgi:predicted transcriptional regulator